MPLLQALSEPGVRAILVVGVLGLGRGWCCSHVFLHCALTGNVRSPSRSGSDHRRLERRTVPAEKGETFHRELNC
ncbi:hypothetical protein Rhow_007116 [Rhodococcus wratislaviensis]|uniref:Uncharacterized protein n=1 Tax=Rhodococcus wratislaviensis TaxID=44752 RepID=A0A402CHE5_RHOWR|nr:hypothetical protein Rhow_007116 [Rhodococcus wratislaviensis]